MKKTYVTAMPDHVGAFLRASRRISELGVNITRVSYNKAVDMHTLFIEADGSPEQIKMVTEALKGIGYLQSDKINSSLIMMEFKLKDAVGSVIPVLELIDRFKFNISYISSQENDSGYQFFKMALFADDRKKVSDFMSEASALCPVRVIDYDKTEKNFDNSVFYISFANELAAHSGLSDKERIELVINANLIMQNLDERNGSPQKTFDFIGKFGEAISNYKGEAFVPRITEYKFSEDIDIVLIEPPCGSNTCIIKNGEWYLFVDTGYACYRNEMLKILRDVIPDFDSCKKAAFVTHTDVDHCGLLNLFDEIYVNRKNYESFVGETEKAEGFREQLPLHLPYVRICKLLTSYSPPDISKLRIIGGSENATASLLEKICDWSYGSLQFEVYEGAGGHVQGETVLIDRKRHIAFTGDIFVNIKGFTAEQAEYNRYAPYLMTSVDADPKLAAREREELMKILGGGEWHIFGGHGSEYIISNEQR